MRTLACLLLGHRFRPRNIETQGVFVTFDVTCSRCGKAAW
jgi:hypothetical protein